MHTLKKQKKTAKKKATPQSQFNDALTRYQRIERQNETFREELHKLAERVTPQIESSERHVLNNLTKLTFVLIPFLSKKTLPEYLREELHEWVNECLELVSFNPFSDQNNVEQLNNYLDTHLNELMQIQNDKFIKKLQRQGHSEEEINEAKSFIDDIQNTESFEDFIKNCENMFGEDENSATHHDFDDTENEDFADYNEHNNQEEKRLDSLLKKTSINKLFRRIAKAVHPDLETDPEKKKEKHKHMAELIGARDDKNIALIFQIYSKVIGDLPTEFSIEDYKSFTKIINHKIETLKGQKESILTENPLHHMFYEWFHSKNTQQETRKIKQYSEDLEKKAKQYGAVADSIRSIKTLRPYLEKRYETAWMRSLDYV